MKIRPVTVLVIYLVLIVSYALLYRYIPNIVSLDEISLLESIYFSSVTITTLGYGEITPKSQIGMLLTSSEAILGIIIIGLFLNSLWQSFTHKIEIAQDKSIKRSISKQNLQRIISYYRYLITVIQSYKVAFAELTTPIKKRKGQLEPNSNFKFSDMQDMYKQSMLTKSGFAKPVIHIYYEKLDELLKELKFLIGNFDLLEFQELHKRVIDFLTLSKAQDVREALFSYEQMGGKGTLLKDNLEEMLKEHKECPELEKYKSNIITPAILLYQTLKFQLQYLKLIEMEFEKIINEQG